jgi:magnesium chelatase family protein
LIFTSVTPVPFENYQTTKGESSVDIRKETAAQNYNPRFEQMENIHYNAQMNTKHIRILCVGRSVKQLLKTAMERLNLSARAYDRILKVARTIADLDAAPK